MNAHSTAYISCAAGGKTYRYHFTGVTSVEHSLSLELGKDAAQGADLVNGARNRPARVTLSVIETDAEHGAGWSARMLEVLDVLKRDRILCRVVTAMGTYRNMLLTEIRAKQDGENPCGWSGSLAFTEYLSAASAGGAGGEEGKVNDNSSARTNTGNAESRKVTGTAFTQMLQRAGINQ